MANDEKQLERNLKGIQCEKEGNVEKAIRLYEQNIKENLVENHPYDRVAIIYNKQGKKEDEIRVLNDAIYVFKNIAPPEREDRMPKLEKFKKRLTKIKK